MSNTISQSASIQSQGAPSAIQRASVETPQPREATQAAPAQISEQDSVRLSRDVEEDDAPTPLAALLRGESPSSGEVDSQPAAASVGKRAAVSETDSPEARSAGSPYVESPYANEGDQRKDMGWLLSHDCEGNPLDIQNDPGSIGRSAWAHNRREHNRIEGSAK